jgi:pimeloyl-ACP methyl ester carboxylesterase
VRRIVKWAKRGLVAIALLLVVVIGAGLLYRAVVQARGEAVLALDAPGSIDEELYVPTNHGAQWLSIRGRDRRNPVVLVVHGGPGGGNSPLLVQFAPFEQRYTIVQWDQPGAGKTFRRYGNTLPAELTIQSVADDGIAVAEFLREHLGADRLILLGWSWGTVIGVEMARQRPELFAAYVGTGQVASIAANEAAVFEQALANARRAGDADAAQQLESIGAPPYGSYDEFTAVRTLSARLAGQPSVVEVLAQLLVAPRYTLLDEVSYIRGMLASADHFMGTGAMDGPVFAVDLPRTARAFDVPVVFIQGENDVVTPPQLARGYFEQLAAPRKEYVALAGAGHTAPLDNAHAFLAALDEHVRPLAPPATGARR